MEIMRLIAIKNQIQKSKKSIDSTRININLLIVIKF